MVFVYIEMWIGKYILGLGFVYKVFYWRVVLVDFGVVAVGFVGWSMFNFVMVTFIIVAVVCR